MSYKSSYTSLAQMLINTAKKTKNNVFFIIIIPFRHIVPGRWHLRIKNEFAQNLEFLQVSFFISDFSNGSPSSLQTEIHLLLSSFRLFIHSLANKNRWNVFFPPTGVGFEPVAVPRKGSSGQDLYTCLPPHLPSHSRERCHFYLHCSISGKCFFNVSGWWTNFGICQCQRHKMAGGAFCTDEVCLDLYLFDVSFVSFVLFSFTNSIAYKSENLLSFSGKSSFILLKPRRRGIFFPGERWEKDSYYFIYFRYKEGKWQLKTLFYDLLK